MKRLLGVAVFVAVLVFPGTGTAFDQAMSVGYGFAALNPSKHLYRIQGGKSSDFFQVTYLMERPCTDYKRLTVFLEPFLAYDNRPNAGVDMGFYTGLKYCMFKEDQKGFFFTAGTGMVYTTIKFEEQGTHLDFTLEAGVGYRFGRFFVEDRLRHYSNGATAKPNRSLDANVLSVGLYF